MQLPTCPDYARLPITPENSTSPPSPAKTRLHLSGSRTRPPVPGHGNTGTLGFVAVPSDNNARKENDPVATDYDEVRSDVKESQDRSLEALQSANAPDARSVVRELDESDALDEAMTPGGEFVAEELIVQVIPQAEDEFTCYSCFLVRHRSQLAREKNGHSYCIECEG